MKTIKIFLASSDELENDRMAFGNLVRRLGNIYEKRGIRVVLIEWEDYDAAYNGKRKQDEYNEEIKASDLFLALFHTKAGQYTVEEFNVATEEFCKHASPKVYVYCKDLQPGETESSELIEFKKRLFEELGHYWCRYGNRDTMQLHFVMQLQLVENSRMDNLKVEENGIVTFDSMPIARMDQLPFTTGNEAYQQIRAELEELPDRIDRAHQRMAKFPNDEDLREDLQAKLNRYNMLKETFAKLQQDLLSTAKTIADFQQQQVSARLRRAIEAFETGSLTRAKILLEDIAIEADRERHIENYEHQQQLADNTQNIVHEDIEAFRLQAKTVIADVSVPIENRITQVMAIYAKADDWAGRSAYPKERYAELLFNYADFLRIYAHYAESKQVYLRQIMLSEEVYGIEHLDIARSYNNIGLVYYYQGDFLKALEYYFKALTIREKVLGPEHSDTAQSYNNIGGIYHHQGNYSKALEYHFKALNIREKVLGFVHSDTAQSYNNIGGVYHYKGDYPKALEYYYKALAICEQILGVDHPYTAGAYNNIGGVYHHQGNCSKALEYYSKALTICESVLGPVHPYTHMARGNIEAVKNAMQQ